MVLRRGSLEGFSKILEEMFDVGLTGTIGLGPSVATKLEILNRTVRVFRDKGCMETAADSKHLPLMRLRRPMSLTHPGRR